MRISISPEVYEKIWTWTHNCGVEVSGYGTTKAIGDPVERIHVDQLFLLEQECTGGSTKPKDAELAKLMSHVSDQGRPEDLRFWWHSHANMEPFWSGEDLDTIDDLRGPPFFVSLVTSKKGNYRLRCDLQTECGFHRAEDRLTYQVRVNEYRSDLIDELDEKVDEEKSVQTYYGHRGIKAYYKNKEVMHKHLVRQRARRSYQIVGGFDDLSYLETIDLLTCHPDGEDMTIEEFEMREEFLEEVADDPSDPTEEEIRDANNMVLVEEVVNDG